MGLESSSTCPDLSTVRFTMSGLAVEAANVAVGRLALRVCTFCICRLTIMKEASRKNIMSIKGMISMRECLSWEERRVGKECRYRSSGYHYEELPIPNRQGVG